MASNEGTRRGFALLLVVAAIATALGFYLLLTESRAAGGVLLVVGAISSGYVLFGGRGRER